MYLYIAQNIFSITRVNDKSMYHKVTEVHICEHQGWGLLKLHPLISLQAKFSVLQKYLLRLFQSHLQGLTLIIWFTCPSGKWFQKFTCPAKILTCPSNFCTSPVKLMYTAEKISTCPDWKITCPVGQVTTKVYVPWDKIYMPQARLNVEPWFIFDRCHCSWAVATHVKHKCDIQ